MHQLCGNAYINRRLRKHKITNGTIEHYFASYIVKHATTDILTRKMIFPRLCTRNYASLVTRENTIIDRVCVYNIYYTIFRVNVGFNKSSRNPRVFHPPRGLLISYDYTLEREGKRALQ